MKRYVKTEAALAKQLGISQKKLRAAWLSHADFPKAGKGGWPVGKCKTFIQAASRPVPPQATKKHKTNAPTIEKYAKTQADLARGVGISAQALGQTWLKKPDFPKRGKAGWPIKKCQEYIQARYEQQLEKMKDQGGGDNRKRTLECEKLEKQIERIKFDLAKEKRKYISLREAHEILGRHAGIVNNVFHVFYGLIKSTAKDPFYISEVERMINNAVDEIKEELDGYESEVH